MASAHRLQQLLVPRGAGIYSICSAHPWVICAAFEQALEDDSCLLIEATCNQVNQYGGYTGMRPAEFRRFVEAIATKQGFPLSKLILGGDHLGPSPWRDLPKAKALARAEELVREYAKAGFTKVHLDASMSCADDPSSLSNDAVASRALRLARAAEDARSEGEESVYVIGTEVPTPGGATHALDGLQVTSVAAADQTWQVHRRAFQEGGFERVWPRILAMVVQPGVEFSHDSVVNYERSKAAELSAWVREGHGPATFEAHSTDYQCASAYRNLVEDGFGILKVGPALTFAMREALLALEQIEKVLVEDGEQSCLAATLDSEMLKQPKDWASHYHGTERETELLRMYSYSDRVRYYWRHPGVEKSVARLVRNLEATPIPKTLLSQYLPGQYERVRRGEVRSAPVALVIDRIRDVLVMYARACSPRSIPKS